VIKLKKKSKNIIVYIIPPIVALFNILIIIYPSQIIASAKSGLLLWFNNVVPSLLPFIIGANILSLTGFINFIGRLSEPLMQKLFKISGCGAFALIMGFISGYPMGAKITAILYENKQINETEAQKLIMFTNNSGPLFILGTVAVSMFKLPETGILIILAHYFAALTIGILLRYTKKRPPLYTKENCNIKSALKELKTNYIKNKLTLGIILNKSIKDSTETITIIGGFVILFSVISKMVEITGILGFLIKTLTPVFSFFKCDPSLIAPVTTGILEITNGCKMLADFPPSITTSALAAGIISWGGFSIHAQAIGFLSKTKIKTSLYLLSKFTQSLLAIIYVYIINLFLKIDFSKASAEAFSQKSVSPISALTNSATYFILTSIIILIFSLIIYKINSRKTTGSPHKH